MKKIMVLGMTLLLLTASACQATQNGPSSSATAQPVLQAESGVLDAAPAAQEDILLNNFVNVYETYCGGAELSPEAPVSMETAGKFLFGWLLEQKQTERYAVYNGSEIDYYTVPEADAEQFCALYFGLGTSAGVSEDGRYEAAKADAPEPVRLKLRLKDTQTLENGNIALTVRRFQGGKEWYPVRYEFAPVTVEEVPPMLEGKTAPGGIQYRFISVTNLPLKPKTEGSEVFIRTAKELSDLAALVNSGDWEYQNNIYRIGADIDLAGAAFTPIGSYQPEDARDPAPLGFCATLEGGGHTIRGLTVRQSGGRPAGLFSVVGESGFVSGLKLENCDVASEDSANAAPVGGIAGEAAGGIARCTVSGRVRGASETGGIVGRAVGSASVQDCRSSASVSGNKRVGGVAGYASSGRFLNCTATGEVNGYVPTGGGIPREIGGFIGRNDGASIERGIVAVRVRADVPSAMTGSFAGYSNGKLSGCFYSTDIPESASFPIGPESSFGYGESELLGMTREQLEETGAFS